MIIHSTVSTLLVLISAASVVEGEQQYQGMENINVEVSGDMQAADKGELLQLNQQVETLKSNLTSTVQLVFQLQTIVLNLNAANHQLSTKLDMMEMTVSLLAAANESMKQQNNALAANLENHKLELNVTLEELEDMDIFLTSQNLDIRNELDTLSKIISEDSIRLSNIKAGQTKTADEIYDIKTEINKAKTESAAIESEDIYQRVTTRNMIDKIGSKFHSNMTAIVDKLTLIKGDLASLSAPVPAFMAVMTAGYIWPVKGEVIRFDSVQVNVGGHYNGDTFKFRCPVAGTYVFSVSIFSGFLSRTHDFFGSLSAAQIVKNGFRLASVYTQNSDPHNYIQAQASTTVIAICNLGEYVYVISHISGPNQYEGYSSDQPTVFSGFMLK